MTFKSIHYLMSVPLFQIFKFAYLFICFRHHRTASRGNHTPILSALYSSYVGIHWHMARDGGINRTGGHRLRGIMGRLWRLSPHLSPLCHGVSHTQVKIHRSSLSWFHSCLHIWNRFSVATPPWNRRCLLHPSDSPSFLQHLRHDACQIQNTKEPGCTRSADTSWSPSV